MPNTARLGWEKANLRWTPPDGWFGGVHPHSNEGKDPLLHRCVQVI